MPWIPAATAAGSLLLLLIRPLVRLLLVRPLSHPTQLEPPCSATSTCPYWICGFVTKRELKLCQTQNSTPRNKLKKQRNTYTLKKQTSKCTTVTELLRIWSQSLAWLCKATIIASNVSNACRNSRNSPRRLGSMALESLALRAAAHTNVPHPQVFQPRRRCAALAALGFLPLSTMAADTHMEVSPTA